MNKEKIDALLAELGGSSLDRESDAIEQLRGLGNKLSSLLLDKYRSSRKWGARCACVYYSFRYVREVNDSFRLGIEALSDKSKVVRFRACELLAYSLRKDAIPPLRELERSAKDDETIENAHAAIDAIENQNINYFVDRDHSGQIIWNV